MSDGEECEQLLLVCPVSISNANDEAEKEKPSMFEKNTAVNIFMPSPPLITTMAAVHRSISSGGATSDERDILQSSTRKFENKNTVAMEKMGKMMNPTANRYSAPKISPSSFSLLEHVTGHSGGCKPKPKPIMPISTSFGSSPLWKYSSRSDFDVQQAWHHGHRSKVICACSECPRCRLLATMRSKPAPDFRSPPLDQFECSCRLCQLLSTAKSELGATCQACQQGDDQVVLLGAAQKLHPVASLPASYGSSCDAKMSATLEQPRRSCPAAASFYSGLVTCREQGVQVSKWSLSSISSYNGPLCRICHSPGDKADPLMSPCRCSGSLKHVHSSCLLRWLEISRRKLHRAPHCELCGYKYQRHKIMKLRQFQCPPCSRRDKVLHFTFFLAILIMLACAAATVFGFRSERHQQLKNASSTSQQQPAPPHNNQQQQQQLTSLQQQHQHHQDRVELSGNELVTLACGVTFFCAFFLAMYVQVKAQASVYKLLMRLWLLNQHWHIDEYRPETDPQRLRRQPLTSDADDDAPDPDSAASSIVVEQRDNRNNHPPSTAL